MGHSYCLLRGSTILLLQEKTWSETNFARMNWSCVLLFIAITATCCSADDDCLEGCKCEKTGELDCSGSGLPDSALIPSGTTILKLDNNQEALTPKYFDSLKNLKKLKLANMGLKSLPSFIFDNLVNLEVLNLSSNSLANNLAANVFQKLTKLKKLFLADNGITELTAAIPSSVTTIDLSGNKMTNIPDDVASLKNVKSAILGHMKTTLTCSCNLEKLARANEGADIKGKCMNAQKGGKLKIIRKIKKD